VIAEKFAQQNLNFRVGQICDYCR